MEETSKPELTRTCPKCNKPIYYVNKYRAKYAEQKHSKCKLCVYWSSLGAKDYRKEKNPFFGKTHSEETKEHYRQLFKDKPISDDHKKAISLGLLNGRANTKPFYQCWVERYGLEIANEKLKVYKEKQRINNSGPRNANYGKPPTQGSGNGWSGWYKEKYFRSLGELSYFITEIEFPNKSWRSAETVDLGIEYICPMGVQRTYFADFLVEEKYLIEYKPKKLWESPKVKAKALAAIQFCKEKGLEYLLVDCPKLPLERVIKLVDEGLIRFLPRYQTKFLEYKEKHGSNNTKRNIGEHEIFLA